MKKLIAAATLLPVTAVAHEGHGAIGLFHHAFDGMIALAIAGVAVYAFKKVKNK